MKETRKEGMDKERTEEREVQRREKNTAGKEEETSAASLGCRWSCSSVRSQRESWWADGSTHSPSLPQEINSPLDLLTVFGPLKQVHTLVSSSWLFPPSSALLPELLIFVYAYFVSVRLQDVRWKFEKAGGSQDAQAMETEALGVMTEQRNTKSFCSRCACIEMIGARNNEQGFQQYDWF